MTDTFSNKPGPDKQSPSEPGPSKPGVYNPITLGDGDGGNNRTDNFESPLVRLFVALLFTTIFTVAWNRCLRARVVSIRIQFAFGLNGGAFKNELMYFMLEENRASEGTASKLCSTFIP
jgi:hypothetical protein